MPLFGNVGFVNLTLAAEPFKMPEGGFGGFGKKKEQPVVANPRPAPQPANQPQTQSNVAKVDDEEENPYPNTGNYVVPIDDRNYGPFGQKLSVVYKEGDRNEKLLAQAMRERGYDENTITNLLDYTRSETYNWSTRENPRVPKGTVIPEGNSYNAFRNNWFNENTKYGLYYGRGPFQITWKKPYEFIGKKLGVDLVNNPDLILDERIMPEAMMLFLEWKQNDMNNGKKFSFQSLEEVHRVWNSGENFAKKQARILQRKQEKEQQMRLLLPKPLFNPPKPR